MIISQLILDTFDLIFDELRSKNLLQKQIQYLSIKDIEHTGVGLFVNFIHDEKVHEFTSEYENVSNILPNGDVCERIDGVEFINDDLHILADISVHLKNGIIDHFEIFVKNGNDYPLTEPKHYKIYQSWIDKSKRRIITR